MPQSPTPQALASTPDQHPTLLHEALRSGANVSTEKYRDTSHLQWSVEHDSKQSSANLAVHQKNVVIFGETGVGKSSVINLIAGREIAPTSSGLTGCTENATSYVSTADGVPIRIFDTVGLEEPETRTNTAFFRAIENACQLVHTLNSAGGIDLFLFCIRGGRITTATQRSHRLFSEFLCEQKIPLAVIATHLERENNMDDWWVQNKGTLKEYGINPIAHACITASTDERDATKREESRKAVCELLSATLATSAGPSLFEDPGKWILDIILRMRDFLKSLKPKGVSKKDLTKRLQERCSLSADEATQVAEIVLGRRNN